MSKPILDAHLSALEAEDKEKSLVASPRDLGRAHWPVDAALGAAAILPLIGCAPLGVFAHAVPATIVRTLAVIWAASLLAFLAGVRRGLSFAEAGGATPGQIASFLGVFFLAILSLLLCSPGMAGIGLLTVGVLDVLSARRTEAPRYFTYLRPIQMAAGATALAIVQWRVG